MKEKKGLKKGQKGSRVGTPGLQAAGWAAVLWLGLLGQGVWAAQTLTNVYTGSAANAGDGDPHRTAYTKINTNMVWLYSLITNPPPDVTNYWRTAATNVLLENPTLFNENQFDAGGLGTNIKAGAQFSNIVFKTTYGANGHDISLQGNVGPAIDVYDYTLGWFKMRLFGDSYGFQFLSGTGSTNWLSLGQNMNTGGGEKEPILRAYAENAKRGLSFAQMPAIGAAVNAHFPMMGGNAASMTGLPMHGPELWKRLPVPPLQVVTAGLAIFIDPNTNGNNEAHYTNCINTHHAAGMAVNMQAAGVPTWYEIETWMTKTRSSGQLQFNSQFPSGGTYLSRYAITNNGLLQLHIDWTAHPGTTVNGKFPSTYTAMTPYSVATDIAWGYGLGIAGFRLGDGQADNTSHETDLAGSTVANSGDAQNGTAFGQQALGMVAHELLYPIGFTPIINGYTNMMASDCFVYNAWQVNPANRWHVPESSAWQANIVSDDQGRKEGPNSGVAIDRPMYQGRYTWTNSAWLIGPGHYVSQVYADNLQGGGNITDTRCHLSMQAMFPGPLWWFGSNVSASISAAFTNSEFLSIFADKAQQPGFPAFDNGSGLTSAWVKPLSDGGYAVLLANETAGAANVTLNWSQMVSPSNYIPVGSSLYPLKVDTNQWFFVRDIWGAADLGPKVSTITVNVAAHGLAFLRFTRAPNYFTSLAVTNTGGLGLNIYNGGNLGTNFIASSGKRLSLYQTNGSSGVSAIHVQSDVGDGLMVDNTGGGGGDIADVVFKGTGPVIGLHRWARQFLVNAAANSGQGEHQLYEDLTVSVAPTTYSFYSGAGASGFPVGYVGIAGNLFLTNGFSMASGSNKRAGSATLSSGVIVVNNTSVASTDLLFVQPKTPGGTAGTHYKYSLSAGTSFTITAVDTSGATVTTDSSTVSWMLVGNP